ncbi:MAG: YjgP/YjgQ family permease [candidate division WS1 bacterium]|jgi:lipopolysaccharide export system permease protein|nr:YjgP/YjgQ family permease [candidate division WS1 bacterium]
MLRVDRYLLGEMIKPLLGGVATFVVMISGHMLFNVVDQIVEHGVDTPSILTFVALQVPYACLLALPASALLASSLALNRLASENELTAMRAGGVGLGRVLWPALALGLVASLLAVGLAQFAVPWANHRSQSLLQRVVAQRPGLAFRPGKFTNTGAGLDFFAEQVDREQGVVNNLYIFQRPAYRETILLVARQARFSEHRLDIGPARFYAFAPGGSLTWGSNEGLHINLGQLQFLPGLTAKKLSDMSLTELLEERASRQQVDPAGGRAVTVELQFRLSLAFACLVFCVLALPATLGFARGQSLVGVLTTLVVVFVYYVIMLWLRMAAEAGHLPPFIAAWLENGILLAAALFALWRQR